MIIIDHFVVLAALSVWAVSLPLLMWMLLRLQWLQFISLQVRGMSISFLLFAAFEF